MGGAIVTEGIFDIKGIGGLVYRSILNKEGFVVTGVVTLLVIVFLLVNLIIDVLYAVLDPRIRYD
jgi:oligopeptide transport system permease protein